VQRAEGESVNSGSELIVEMLRRSYFAVDGLWYVMVEEEFGPDMAMELDERVWQVMPKIQARKARELIDCQDDSPAALVRCMALKFAAEGHDYVVRIPAPGEAEIVIRRCPWREVLESSGRTHLGPEIADRICATEGATWAAEFGDGIDFAMTEAICHGADRCRFVFRRAHGCDSPE